MHGVKRFIKNSLGHCLRPVSSAVVWLSSPLHRFSLRNRILGLIVLFLGSVSTVAIFNYWNDQLALDKISSAAKERADFEILFKEISNSNQNLNVGLLLAVSEGTSGGRIEEAASSLEFLSQLLDNSEHKSVIEFKPLFRDYLEQVHQVAQLLADGKLEKGLEIGINSIPKSAEKMQEFTDGLLINHRKMSEEQLIQNHKNNLKFIVILIGVFLLSFVFLWIVTGHAVEPVAQSNSLLKIVVANVDQAATVTREFSRQIQQSSKNVVSMATKTESTMSEFSEIIDKTDVDIRQTSEVARKTMRISDECSESVNNLDTTIVKIYDRTNLMVESIEKIKTRVKESVEQIVEISETTKVIDDIVFQTKLLSFNASVEAARAGEHGRGFSIVADEIGKLAGVSGAAAGEISGIVERCRADAEAIVEDIQQSIDDTTNALSSVVDDGRAQSQHTKESLSSVLSSMQEVLKSVDNISKSSNEHTRGIGSVSDSMRELRKYTNVIQTVSGEALESSHVLSDQSSELANTVAGIDQAIKGRKKAS